MKRQTGDWLPPHLRVPVPGFRLSAVRFELSVKALLLAFGATLLIFLDDLGLDIAGNAFVAREFHVE